MEEVKTIEIVSDGTRLMSYAEHERIRRNQKLAIWITAVLVTASLLVAYFNRTFNSYEELHYTQNSEGNSTWYENFGDGYLKYSKDGISYLNGKEELLWNEAYTMSKPEAVTGGGYAAVADLEGNTVILYDQDGKVGQYAMSYPIQEILVAEQGVFCVVLDGDGFHYIRLYDAEGSLLAEIKTQIKNNGYPIAIALSDDGSRLAASFFRVEGIDSQNSICFYNFGEGGKGQSGNLVGSYQLDNMLIPKITFTDTDTVFAIGDSKMLVYNVEGKPEQKKEIVYPSNILAVFANDKYVGFTCENPAEEVEAEEALPYEVYVYGRSGRMVRHFGVEKTYENVKIIDDLIIGYTGTKCAIVRTNGTEVFSGDMGRNITDILPTDKATEFLFVYGDSSGRIRLKNDYNQVLETEEVESTE